MLKTLLQSRIRDGLLTVVAAAGRRLEFGGLWHRLPYDVQP